MLGPGNMPVSRRDFTGRQPSSMASLVVVKPVIFLTTETLQQKKTHFANVAANVSYPVVSSVV